MTQGGFLTDIGIVLGVAAVTSFLARRFKLPTTLGYLFAGIIVGPYVPLPLFADLHRVETMSEFGVILVMFAVGLEFRIKKLFQVLPNAGFTAFIEMSTLFLIGTLVADFLGWTTTQGIFLGSALSISSTMLVSKVFADQPPQTDVRRQVFGILIIQDIAAILILALLGTIAAGLNKDSPKPVEVMTQLGAILIAISVVGLFVIPKFVRKVSKLKSEETLVVVSMGICFGLALIVENLGYSVALGAFLAGMLVSESGLGNKIEHLIFPIKDMFAAIFFVSIGMQINPVLAMDHLPSIFLLSFLVVFFQFLSVSVSGVLSGVGLTNSINSGFALGQIGEFAFIIAAIGTKAGLLQDSFQTIIIAVAVVTSISTPLIWKSKFKFISFIDKNLPKKADVLINLYEAWFKQLKKTAFNNINLPRRILFAVFIDLVLLVTIPPLLLAVMPKVQNLLEDLDLSYGAIQLVIAAAVMTLFIPIVFSLISNIGKLLTAFVNEVFHFDSEIKSASSANAIQLFRLAFQILVLYVIWIPLMISVKTFISSDIIYYMVLITGLLVTVYLIYKSDSGLDSKKNRIIVSGGERILDVLSKHSFPDSDELESIGLSDLISIKVTNPEVINKTLSEINLRAKTGCSIISIKRNKNRILFPKPTDILYLGDHVQISGDTHAVSNAVKALSIEH